MNDINNITSDDLALYALDLLDPQERSALEQKLANQPSLREELAAVRGDLSIVALSAEMQDPPPLARARFLKEVTLTNLSSQRQAQSVKPPVVAIDSTAATVHSIDEPVRRRSIAPAIFGGLGWALAAGLAFGVFNLNNQRHGLQQDLDQKNDAIALATQQSERARLVLEAVTSPKAQRFTLAKTNTPPPTSGRIMYLADNGSLVFQGNNLEALPTAKTYELWIIPAEAGKAPVAAGTFKPDVHGYASLILPDLPKGIVASKFGVTIEDDGGAQTPTMPIVMMGQ